MTLTESGPPGRVMAGPISHTSTQWMGFVEIFDVSLDLSTIYQLVLMGVEFHLCVVVTSSQNAMINFLESS